MKRKKTFKFRKYLVVCIRIGHFTLKWLVSIGAQNIIALYRSNIMRRLSCSLCSHSRWVYILFNVHEFHEKINNNKKRKIWFTFWKNSFCLSDTWSDLSFQPKKKKKMCLSSKRTRTTREERKKKTVGISIDRGIVVVARKHHRQFIRLNKI